MAIYEVWRGNENWLLSGGGLCYRVSTMGLGIAPVRRLRQRGPFQHGVSDRGFRLDERTLLLELVFQANNPADADARRDTLAEIFKPTSIPLRLRVTRDDGNLREIQCYTEGLIDFPDQPTRDRLGVSQRVVASLYCPEPVWYDPTLRTLVFGSVQNGWAGFDVPALIPYIQTVAESFNTVEVVAYNGNWLEFPVIEVTGALGDLVITNETTGEKLDFTGATIAAGETYTIDLRYEYQTVTSSVHGNAMANLTASSDLATWHLAAAPEAQNGMNSIRVEALNPSATAQVVFRYYDRFVHS